MKRLLKLMLLIGLFAGMVSGAVVHASETPNGHEMSAASQWFHVDGDGDQVPADADRDYPHHHSICHGHDLATPMKMFAPGIARAMITETRVSANAPPASSPFSSPLRPPIA